MLTDWQPRRLPVRHPLRKVVVNAASMIEGLGLELLRGAGCLAPL